MKEDLSAEGWICGDWGYANFMGLTFGSKSLTPTQLMFIKRQQGIMARQSLSNWEKKGEGKEGFPPVLKPAAFYGPEETRKSMPGMYDGREWCEGVGNPLCTLGVI